MLPGIEGMSVLSGLRGAGVETPVIILSALGSPEDRV
jgi:two-component system OmpR family response regulator